MACLGHGVTATPLWLTLIQAVFRDVDVIAVGQEPCPLFPGYQTGGTVDLADVRTLAGLCPHCAAGLLCSMPEL